MYFQLTERALLSKVHLFKIGNQSLLLPRPQYRHICFASKKTAQSVFTISMGIAISCDVHNAIENQNRVLKASLIAKIPY